MHVVLVIVVFVLVAGLVYWPNVWVSKVMQKYKSPEDLFSGTGGELAEHLLQELKIDDVEVEETAPGQDHYDPVGRAVRLSPDNFNGKSLTAITIAAHEVGHAMQHAKNYHFFKIRYALARVANVTEKAGSISIMAMPVVALMTRSPVLGVLLFILGIAGIAFGTLVHLVTLPVEWDASFNRALPMLTRGKYISERHSWHARKILKAAAFTYVAGSLASLFNLYRWIAILKR